MDISRREKRKLRENSGQEIKSEQKPQLINNKPKSKFLLIASIVGVLILVITSYSVYSMKRPGPYDSFAKCISQKGAVMYGAMDWCKFTQAQKAMFGRSFKYVNYHEFNELQGIKKTPTWVINGKWHENVQSFEELAALTECSLN